MAEIAVEEKFAQKLASNDLPVRNRAIKRLKRWIEARSALEDGFSEMELLKLWKGLFVCMWHSDKPLVQEEMANTLSQLIHIFQLPERGLQFVSVFFATMSREWLGIDRLRLDKFYMLIRKMMRQTFELLQQQSWNKELVRGLVSTLSDGPFNTDTVKASLGIQLHLLEVYFPELSATVASCGDQSVPVADLVEPCLLLFAGTSDSTIIKCIEVNILHPLENKTAIPSKHVEYNVLADQLRRLATDRKTVGRNRKRLYNLCKRFAAQHEEELHAAETTTKQKKRKKMKATSTKLLARKKRRKASVKAV